MRLNIQHGLRVHIRHEHRACMTLFTGGGGSTCPLVTVKAGRLILQNGFHLGGGSGCNQ